jgi:hypothetical protein
MEYKLNLSNTENKDLVSYCNMNDLRISEVIKKAYLEGFNIERYGLTPGNIGGTQEKFVEKEVIVEKRVEIPVEVIKEVVKIEYIEVEKPVEVIKEVQVEKIVEVVKEVPVDRVVEKVVEIVKEVPVEKVVIKDVIKEVPVEKIVYVTDQEEMNSRIFQKEQEFEEQRQIFSIKTRELENNFHNEKNELLLRIQQLETKEPEVKEIIREVEVIKEIVIEKEGDSNLKPKLDALQLTVQKLKQDNIEKDKTIREYEQTIQDIQKFQDEKKAMFMRGSNLDDKLYK